MNRHLNLFHHYNQIGALPIENNISRGLAILLSDNPGFLFLFLNLIREKAKLSTKELYLPKESYYIGFQERCSDLKEASSIFAISLTASELLFDNLSYENNDIDNPITDISISYEDILFIIEVKRNSTDCRNQLKGQVGRYHYFNRDNSDCIKSFFVDLTWKEVMDSIERYQKMTNGKAGRIVEDFYDEVIYHFPNWAPIKPLSKLNVDNIDQIDQRIERLKALYQKEYCGDKELRYKRNAIPLDLGWASELNVYLDIGFVNENGQSERCVILGIWPANTCGQYWYFKAKVKHFELFESKYNEIALSDCENVKIRVKPYIKFAHWNKGIINLYDESIKHNMPQLFELGDSITHKWKRDDWEDLKRIVCSSDIFSSESINWFKDEFKNKFEASEKSYADVSLGFELLAYIPFEKAQILDEDKCDELPAFVSFCNKFLIKLEDLER